VREVQVSAARTLGDIDLLAVRGRQQIATSGEALDRVLAKSGDAVTQADKLLASVNEMTAPRSPIRGDLEATLRDLAASAGSLRTLTRELQRDPSATLLKGVGK
jgi:paraquat-inducible protein B